VLDWELYFKKLVSCLETTLLSYAPLTELKSALELLGVLMLCFGNACISRKMLISLNSFYFGLKDMIALR
jgi:hypothetical protein